jgi:hypothetical protein
MQLTSPIFHSGAVEVRRDVWSDGLLEMGAIMKSWVLTDGQSRFACDAETLESVTLHVSELQQELIGMIAALGAVVSQVRDDAVPAGTMANIGYLIGGLSTLQADLNTALDWMRPAPGYSPVGDMQLISKARAAQACASGDATAPETASARGANLRRRTAVAPFIGPADNEVHWYELDPTYARSELKQCRSASGDDETKAGARFARSLLRTVLGEGSPTIAEKGFDVQTFFAVAARDAQSEEFILGFAMAIGAYFADRSDQVTWDLDWDPVDSLVRGGMCDPDPAPLARPAASSGSSAARKSARARTKTAFAVAA